MATIVVPCEFVILRYSIYQYIFHLFSEIKFLYGWTISFNKTDVEAIVLYKNMCNFGVLISVSEILFF